MAAGSFGEHFDDVSSNLRRHRAQRPEVAFGVLLVVECFRHRAGNLGPGGSERENMAAWERGSVGSKKGVQSYWPPRSFTRAYTATPLTHPLFPPPAACAEHS